VIELTSEYSDPPTGWLELLDPFAVYFGAPPSTGASTGDALVLPGIASAETPRASAMTTWRAMRPGRDVVAMV
jgi:hypothetical protein